MPESKELSNTEATETTRLRAIRDEDSGHEISMKGVKIRYCLILSLGFCIALLFRLVPSMNKMFKPIHAMHDKCGDDTKGFCMASTLTLRISFSLFVFFMLHVLLSTKWMRLCFGPNSFSTLIQSGFICKILLLVVLFVSSLFIPFDFFAFVYGRFCIGSSVLFLFMQTILLLHFAYEWNDNWASAEGWESTEDGNRKRTGTIAATILCFVGGCAITGVGYYAFNPSTCEGSEQSLHLFFLTFTLIFGILSTLASAKVDGGSILISSFAFLYCSVITFAALSAGSASKDCDLMWSDPSSVNFSTIISLVIAAFAVVYASVAASGQRHALSINGVPEEEEEEETSFPFFFLCFAMGSCYLAMTLLSWEIPTGPQLGESTDVLRSDTSRAAMWIKMATVWTTMVLFSWALIAPTVCKNREF